MMYDYTCITGTKEQMSAQLAKQGMCNICDHRWSMRHKVLKSHKNEKSLTYEIMKILCPPGYHQNANVRYGPLMTSYIVLLA